LVEQIGDRPLLVVLDNVEHVLGAGAGVEALLAACPAVKVLATSRECLSTEGETIYPVPPLPVPPEVPPRDPDVLRKSASVDLFVIRAHAMNPGFALNEANAPAIARICRHLDGLPLSLELAAALVKSLPVGEIADRLPDRFRLLVGGRRSSLPQHQSLRALVDWSFDHLTRQERTILRRLSVFAGGWSLESAEEICSGKGIERWELLDLMAKLVEKSMVDIDYDRARLCEQPRTPPRRSGIRARAAGESSEEMPRLLKRRDVPRPRGGSRATCRGSESEILVGQAGCRRPESPTRARNLQGDGCRARPAIGGISGPALGLEGTLD
jgi:predicted ATPase